jgi:hypothetical protein
MKRLIVKTALSLGMLLLALALRVTPAFADGYMSYWNGDPDCPTVEYYWVTNENCDDCTTAQFVCEADCYDTYELGIYPDCEDTTGFNSATCYNMCRHGRNACIADNSYSQCWQ